jgi:condensin complex subunit 3
LAEGYWKELSPESAVLARIFVEHCASTKNEVRLELASLPVVTAFAFIVQEAYNALLAVLEEIETAKLLRAGLEEQEDEEMEEELTKREVIMGEMLKMVLKLDYGDEIGRRKVFSVVSECYWSYCPFFRPGFNSCCRGYACASTASAEPYRTLPRRFEGNHAFRT